MPELSTEGYAPPGEERPLRGYALLSWTFATMFSGGLAAARATGHEIPERVAAGDVVLIGLATHKLTRILSKAKVTSYIRAPFTEFQENVGRGETRERARGDGARKAIGELLVCPHCLGQWVAGAFTIGLVVDPPLTRLLAGMLTAQTISDVAQVGYVAAVDRA